MKIFVNKYEMSSSLVEEELKIINISDIHSDVKLLNHTIEEIEKYPFDLITITGDLFDTHNNKHNKIIFETIKDLADKYLVIYAKGNHEDIYQSKGHDYVEELKKTKCVVLSNDNKYKYKKITFHSINLDNKWYKKGEKPKEYFDLLDKYNFSNKSFNVLLSHTPNPFIINGTGIKSINNLNLVLCGHNHGGLTYHFIRPLSKKNRGLYGPYKKFFVTGAYGYYANEDTNLIISDGVTKLSHHSFPNDFIRGLGNKTFGIDINYITIKSGKNYNVKKQEN